MASALDSRSSTLALAGALSSVLLGKILYSHSISLHPGVSLDSGNLLLG